jgi:hypothetical protein
LGMQSVVASAFCVLDRYTSESFGRLRYTRVEGACGVSSAIGMVLGNDTEVSIWSTYGQGESGRG